MKSLLITTLLALMITSAQAAVRLRTGTYKGKHFQNYKETDVYMMINSLTRYGRRGSFLGVIFDEDFKKVSLYSIDKIDASKYALTPLEVTADGEIGIVDDNPSLDLVVSSHGDSLFKITSSQSGNNLGFNGHIIIDESSNDYYWQRLMPGDYEFGHICDALTVSNFDSHEGEANSLFTAGSLNGSFSIREKFPKMFVLNETKTLATGTETSQIPRKIGIFVNRHRVIFADTMHFLLINPADDTDVMDFEED